MIRGFVLVAEAVEPHADGSFSAVRACLPGAVGDELPADVMLAIVVRLDAEVGDERDHEFMVDLLDEDRQPIGLPRRGVMRVIERTQYSMTKPFEWKVRFEKCGNVLFRLRLGESVLYEAPFRVGPAGGTP